MYKTKDRCGMNRFRLGLGLLALLGLPTAGLAGAIHATHKWAWAENAGYLNFRATNATVSSEHEAAIHPDGDHGYMSGWAWSEMVGWIKLGNTNGGAPYANTDATNWGVNVAGSNLSGFAWSESAGWINFAPTGATVSARVAFQVASGQFDGYAWSESFGWIHVRGVGASPLYSLDALTTPHVGPVTVWRATNQILKVSDAMLMTNAVDPEGSDMAVVWVSSVSTNGGTVVLSGRWTTYVPPAGDDSPDYFTFRIRNAIGGEADGQAEVLLRSPEDDDRPTRNIANITPAGPDILVRFIGIPGRTYDVQAATNLVNPAWTDIGSCMVGGQGDVIFTDTNPPVERYYRTAGPE